MQLLKELMVIIEAKEVSHMVAAAVYHRDYVKTKKKPYRKYDPKKRKEQVKEGFSEPMPYTTWMRKMKANGATKFDQAEMDVVLAYDNDGVVVGAYDKQKQAEESLVD